MDGPVLVAYATKRGATAEIAERIGRAIEQAGLPAAVLPVDEVSALDEYSGVVVGSAVYIGRWRKEAVIFLKSHETELARTPAWIFSSGPTGEGKSDAFMDDAPLPKSVRATAESIHPRDIAIFHGAIDPEQLSAFERWIVKRVKAPVGDFREWDDIEAWGTHIADELMHVEPQTPVH